MKVAIAGAGAVGGVIGSRLALSGQAKVSVLARGQTLAALRDQGWRLQTKDGDFQTPVTASDRPEELGVQDLLIVAVKGPALPALAPSLRPLIGPRTAILPTMNGVPWWFCLVDGPFLPFPLKSVDPQSTITASLPVSQTLGCVVHVGASCPEPGVARHVMGNELIIGDAAGGRFATRGTDRGPSGECRARHQAVGKRPLRHLVQALGQPDDESRYRRSPVRPSTACSATRWFAIFARRR